MRMPAKTASMAALNATPPADGRIRKMKRVIRPRMLVIAKWTRKTSKPCSQTLGRPEPMPNAAAPIGRKSPYAMTTLGRKGLSSERANEMTSVIAPRAKTTSSGIHNREWMKTLLSVIGMKRRAAKPVSKPPRKTKRMLMNNAISVSNMKRKEPVRTASKNPTQGVISGATRMPNIKTACESSR